MNQFLKNNVIDEKFNDAQIPELHIEFDPDEACQVGAFIEDALNMDDASDSCCDLEDNL